MKLATNLLVVCCAAGVASFTSAETPASPGSIRPAAKTAPADLPALAKIDLVAAVQAARTAVAGSVLQVKLEVEDGSLVYSVVVAAADKSLSEIEVDAGNGKVLAVEKEDHDDERHGSGKKEKEHRKGKHHEDEDDDEKDEKK